MTDIIIKLKDGFTLADVAQEVQLLNTFVDGDKFPRPIKCNPDATQDEGFLGDVNTPPDANGFVQIRLMDYEWFDLGILDMLPAKPTTFSFGYAQTGVFA
jgi:hypothetical protein